LFTVNHCLIAWGAAASQGRGVGRLPSLMYSEPPCKTDSGDEGDNTLSISLWSIPDLCLDMRNVFQKTNPGCEYRNDHHIPPANNW